MHLKSVNSVTFYMNTTRKHEISLNAHNECYKQTLATNQSISLVLQSTQCSYVNFKRFVFSLNGIKRPFWLSLNDWFSIQFQWHLFFVCLCSLSIHVKILLLWNQYKVEIDWVNWANLLVEINSCTIRELIIESRIII